MSNSLFQSGIFNNRSFISKSFIIPSYKEDNHQWNKYSFLFSPQIKEYKDLDSSHLGVWEENSKLANEIKNLKKKYDNILEENTVYKATIDYLSQQNQILLYNKTVESTKTSKLNHDYDNSISDLIYTNIKELEEKYSNAIKTINEFKMKINNINALIKGKDKEIIYGKSEINKLQIYINELEEVNNHLNKDLENYKSNSYNHYSFESGAVISGNHFEDTQSYISLEHKYNELFNENSWNKKQMQQFKDENIKWFTENTFYTKNNKNLINEVDDLKRKVTEMENSIQQMNQINNKFTLDSINHLSQISQLEVVNQQLNSENLQLKARIPSLQEIQSRINEESLKRNNEFNQITKLFEEVQQKNNLLIIKDNAIAERDTLINQKELELVRLKETIREVEARNSSLGIELEKLKENYIAKEKEKDLLLEDQKKALEEKSNKTYEKSYNLLYLQLKKCKKIIQYLSNWNTTIQTQLHDAEESKTKYKIKISAYDWQITSYESKWELKEEEIKNWKIEIENFKSQEESYNKDIQELINNRGPFDSDNIPQALGNTFKQAFNKLRILMNSCKRVIKFLVEKNAELEHEKEEAFKQQSVLRIPQNKDDSNNNLLLKKIKEQKESIERLEGELCIRNKWWSDSQWENAKLLTVNNYISQDIINISEIVQSINASNAQDNTSNNSGNNNFQCNSTTNQSGGIDIQRNKDFTQCMNELRKATKIINYLMKLTLKK